MMMSVLWLCRNETQTARLGLRGFSLERKRTARKLAFRHPPTGTVLVGPVSYSTNVELDATLLCYCRLVVVASSSLHASGLTIMSSDSSDGIRQYGPESEGKSSSARRILKLRRRITRRNHGRRKDH